MKLRIVEFTDTENHKTQITYQVQERWCGIWMGVGPNSEYGNADTFYFLDAAKKYVEYLYRKPRKQRVVWPEST